MGNIFDRIQFWEIEQSQLTYLHKEVEWEQSSEFPADCMHCLSICLESFSFFHSIQILQKIDNLNKISMLLSVEDWILFTNVNVNVNVND